MIKKAEFNKNWINFYIPILLYGVCFLIDNWLLAIIFFIIPFLYIKKEYLFLYYIATSFFNIMILDGIFPLGSMITSYFALALILIRVNKLVVRNKLYVFLALVSIIMILLNFSVLTIGEYYIRTGLKSSIQLIFLILICVIISLAPNDILFKNRIKFEKLFNFFLIPYLFCSLFFLKERLEGFVGAQALGLMLSLYIIYSIKNTKPKNLLFLLYMLFLILTGSRTALAITISILIFNVYSKSSLIKKVLSTLTLPALLILLFFILPLITDRLNFSNSKIFFGSLLGRFHNYAEAWHYIKLNPIFGTGMGSILKTLENWIFVEGFELYKKTGDTTIIHNEYLRVLMEMGIAGLILFFIALKRAWKSLRNINNRYLLIIFLIASLVENTLTLWTTGMLFFIFIINLAINKGQISERLS